MNILFKIVVALMLMTLGVLIIISAVEIKSNPLTIKWATDLDIESMQTGTNRVMEFGFRSDGVMVWREMK